jgi:hypothetical protein
LRRPVSTRKHTNHRKETLVSLILSEVEPGLREHHSGPFERYSR